MTVLRDDRDIAALVDGLNFKKEADRSPGCGPCTRIPADPDERAGRRVGTSKCGGGYGIGIQPLKLMDGAGV